MEEISRSADEKPDGRVWLAVALVSNIGTLMQRVAHDRRVTGAC